MKFIPWIIAFVALGTLLISVGYIIVLRVKIWTLRKMSGNGITPYAKVLEFRESFESAMIFKDGKNSEGRIFSFKRIDQSDPLHRFYNIIDAVTSKKYGELAFNFVRWPDYAIVYEGVPYFPRHFSDFLRIVRADAEKWIQDESASTPDLPEDNSKAHAAAG